MYSVAKYSWAEKGFSFEAEYKFVYDSACGYKMINHHSGKLAAAYAEREGKRKPCVKKHASFYFSRFYSAGEHRTKSSTKLLL